MFSPRARGCSVDYGTRRLLAAVFPACAGMFLPILTRAMKNPGFPRVRGDVPIRIWATQSNAKFSPRARGCSFTATLSVTARQVFPACAGMFPDQCSQYRLRWCFPRVRGDVPSNTSATAPCAPFSPRARGCSLAAALSPIPWRVFPACAGMFRPLPRDRERHHCFPRVRGDVPMAQLPLGPSTLFSPRARGCSEGRG